MQKFQLKRIAAITPGCGEDLGGALAKAADAMISVSEKVQTLYLAADAFEAGAAASIGHNRADSYQRRANDLRSTADRLFAEQKAEREAAEDARMFVSFMDGFEGRDGSSYSFDRRAAFIVGKHLATASATPPAKVRATREGIEVDGRLYVVEYPGGKISEAFARAA